MTAWIMRHLNAMFMAGGLGTLAYGGWLVYEPLAFLLVGAVLLWMGLPE